VKTLDNGLLLTQEKYAPDIPTRACMSNCKLVTTPLSASKNLLQHAGDWLGPKDVTKYQSIVSALQYLSHTHSDLAYSINKLCQFLRNVSCAHGLAGHISCT
jgi:hypothetical protein